MIIAFSGKLGTGKTHAAGAVCRLLGLSAHHSFGDVIREGASRRYDFDIELTRSQEGKTVILSCGLTVREAMQAYGRDMRDMDPDFILNAVREDFENDKGIFVIDDVRMPGEYAWVRSIPASVLVRMDPNPDWEPGPHARDITETALDDCVDWDLRLSLPRVLNNGDFLPLDGHAVAVCGKLCEKMTNFLSTVANSQADAELLRLPLKFPFGETVALMADAVRNPQAGPAAPRP